MAVFAPDLRGFGATASRGLWPGTDGFTADIRVMVRLLRARYPHTRLILMAESMGAAALMVLATEPDPPKVDGYVLIAPAVWGRPGDELLHARHLVARRPYLAGMALTGRGFVKVTASDNREALIRLSTDPLTIHATRVDAIKGLVDLMDQALRRPPHFHAPALFLYGGHDELVPARATAATWRGCRPARCRHFIRTATICCCATRTGRNRSATSWPGSVTRMPAAVGRTTPPPLAGEQEVEG